MGREKTRQGLCVLSPPLPPFLSLPLPPLSLPSSSSSFTLKPPFAPFSFSSSSSSSSSSSLSLPIHSSFLSFSLFSLIFVSSYFLCFFHFIFIIFLLLFPSFSLQDENISPSQVFFSSPFFSPSSSSTILLIYLPFLPSHLFTLPFFPSSSSSHPSSPPFFFSPRCPINPFLSFPILSS